MQIKFQYYRYFLMVIINFIFFKAIFIFNPKLFITSINYLLDYYILVY